VHTGISGFVLGLALRDREEGDDLPQSALLRTVALALNEGGIFVNVEAAKSFLNMMQDGLGDELHASAEGASHRERER